MLLLVLLLTSAFFIWRYYNNNRNYWKSKGISGPPASLFLGNYWDITDRENPRGLVLKEWTKKYGKVYGIKEGTRNTLVVSDPALLQDVFVNKFEDFYGRRETMLHGNPDKDERVSLFRARGLRWKRLRTICASAFTSGNLKKIHSTVQDSSIELVRLLEQHVDEEPVDVYSFYQEYTLDIICRITMGQSESKMFQNPLINFVNKIFDRNMRHPLFIIGECVPLLRQMAKKLYKLVAGLQISAIKPLIGAIFKTVSERISQREKDAHEGIESEEQNDFVDLFLDARAEGDLGDVQEFAKNNMKISKSLTTHEIIAQCSLFLLAGYDTTSNTLAYASWLLAKHPEVQTKVQKEIDDVCGHDQVIDYDSISKMKYTEMVIKETLRMYPLANIAVARAAMKDTTLGSMKIEEGTEIVADLWSLHYDKQLWGENADKFVPERWEDDNIKHTTAWLPFGGGPRVCLGMRLAYIEAKLALAHILRRFDLVMGPKSEGELKLVGTTTISPASVTLYIKNRSLA